MSQSCRTTWAEQETFCGHATSQAKQNIAAKVDQIDFFVFGKWKMFFLGVFFFNSPQLHNNQEKQASTIWYCGLIDVL